MLIINSEQVLLLLAALISWLTVYILTFAWHEIICSAKKPHAAVHNIFLVCGAFFLMEKEVHRWEQQEWWQTCFSSAPFCVCCSHLRTPQVHSPVGEARGQPAARRREAETRSTAPCILSPGSNRSLLSRWPYKKIIPKCPGTAAQGIRTNSLYCNCRFSGQFNPRHSSVQIKRDVCLGKKYVPSQTGKTERLRGMQLMLWSHPKFEQHGSARTSAPVPSLPVVGFIPCLLGTAVPGPPDHRHGNLASSRSGS